MGYDWRDGALLAGIVVFLLLTAFSVENGGFPAIPALLAVLCAYFFGKRYALRAPPPKQAWSPSPGAAPAYPPGNPPGVG